MTKDPFQALPAFLGALAKASTSTKTSTSYENPFENKDLR